MTSSSGASWIYGDGPSEPGWPGIAGLAPAVFAGCDTMEQELAGLAPVRVVELCRARMAILLGVDPPWTSSTEASSTEDRWAELPQWSVSSRFSEAEKAALDVAEQFVIDVKSVVQEQIDRLLRHFTPEETLGLVSSLWFEEAMLRLGAVLGVARPRASHREI